MCGKVQWVFTNIMSFVMIIVSYRIALLPPNNPLCFTYLAHTLLSPNCWRPLIFSLSLCHITEIKQYVVFLGWLPSLSNINLRSIYVFLGFIAHFNLSLDNIPLNGWTTNLSIELLKDSLAASRFWWLWIKLLLIFRCRLSGRHTFSNQLEK